MTWEEAGLVGWPPPIEGKQVKEESVQVKRTIYDWAKEEDREAPSH